MRNSFVRANKCVKRALQWFSVDLLFVQIYYNAGVLVKGRLENTHVFQTSWPQLVMQVFHRRFVIPRLAETVYTFRPPIKLFNEYREWTKTVKLRDVKPNQWAEDAMKPTLSRTSCHVTNCWCKNIDCSSFKEVTWCVVFKDWYHNNVKRQNGRECWLPNKQTPKHGIISLSFFLPTAFLTFHLLSVFYFSLFISFLPFFLCVGIWITADV